MRFSGFPMECFAFYRDLEASNTREWWYDNRWVYDDIVRPTLEAFISELPWQYQPMHIFRPYRQVRFSKDKTPYKTAIGANGGSPEGSVHYVQLSAEGVRAATGFYAMSWDQLERYRAAVASDAGVELQLAVRELIAAGWDVNRAPWLQEPLSTAPRGYDRNHERVWYLQARSLTINHTWTVPNGWMQSRRAISQVLLAWQAGDRMNRWMGEHVGPPDL